MLSYKYHEWSTGTFDTIKISSYFLLKMNKFSLVTGLNCPEQILRPGKLNSQFIVTNFSVLYAGGRSLFRFHISYSV